MIADRTTPTHPLDTKEVCAVCKEPLPRDESGHVRYHCLPRYDARIQWEGTVKVSRPWWDKAVIRE